MVIFKCDGCGLKEESKSGAKPYDWFARTDSKQNIQYHACSRKCVEDAPGHSTIIPI